MTSVPCLPTTSRKTLVHDVLQQPTRLYRLCFSAFLKNALEGQVVGCKERKIPSMVTPKIQCACPETTRLHRHPCTRMFTQGSFQTELFSSVHNWSCVPGFLYCLLWPRPVSYYSLPTYWVRVAESSLLSEAPQSWLLCLKVLDHHKASLCENTLSSKEPLSDYSFGLDMLDYMFLHTQCYKI